MISGVSVDFWLTLNLILTALVGGWFTLNLISVILVDGWFTEI